VRARSQQLFNHRNYLVASARLALERLFLKTMNDILSYAYL